MNPTDRFANGGKADFCPDTVLVDRLRRSETSALEEIYDRHAGTILAICLRILRDRERAEEVMQDILWQLWDKPDRFDPKRGRLASFLAMSARSRALDRLRAEQSQVQRIRAARIELDAPAMGTAPTAPDRKLVENHEGKRVREAVTNLSELYREIVVLCYFEGLTQLEISERLELPIGTVKTRLRRGLEQLRRGFGSGEEQ